MRETITLLHQYPELALFVTIFLGTLIGRVHVKGFGLGSVVGSLLAGIVVGIFTKPEFPELLRWVFFYLFLFSIGYSGPHAVQAYDQQGGGFFASIFLCGMVGTMVPSLVTLVMGRWIFRMNPLMVLAGVTGAQTCMPALNALREASGSNVGALGYTVPYAIGSILLTISDQSWWP